MDIKNIRELSEIFEKIGLSKLEISEGETRITFEKNNDTQINQHAEMKTPIVINQEQSQTSVVTNNQEADFNNITEVKSPMVGVFYSSPAPDAEPFVKIGSKVKKGDVLCIVEAMKLMNEITADTDGEIADICVQNGQVVEFSQTLFKLY